MLLRCSISHKKSPDHYPPDCSNEHPEVFSGDKYIPMTSLPAAVCCIHTARAYSEGWNKRFKSAGGIIQNYIEYYRHIRTTSRLHLAIQTLGIAMRFVGNYALRGLAPQTDSMPVIPKNSLHILRGVLPHDMKNNTINKSSYMAVCTQHPLSQLSCAGVLHSFRQFSIYISQ